MKIGKNTGTRQNATFATKASSKTCIAIQWLFMILIQGNTAARVTEDATIKQQKKKYVRYERRKPKDKIDEWIANNQETCLFCGEPLLAPNF